MPKIVHIFRKHEKKKKLLNLKEKRSAYDKIEHGREEESFDIIIIIFHVAGKVRPFQTVPILNKKLMPRMVVCTPPVIQLS